MSLFAHDDCEQVSGNTRLAKKDDAIISVIMIYEFFARIIPVVGYSTHSHSAGHYSEEL